MVVAVIVGSYNHFSITSIVVITVIVGFYNQYFITSTVVVAVTTVDVIKY
jgi:hypothetical protein